LILNHEPCILTLKAEWELGGYGGSSPWSPAALAGFVAGTAANKHQILNLNLRPELWTLNPEP